MIKAECFNLDNIKATQIYYLSSLFINSHLPFQWKRVTCIPFSNFLIQRCQVYKFQCIFKFYKVYFKVAYSSPSFCDMRNCLETISLVSFISEGAYIYLFWIRLFAFNGTTKKLNIIRFDMLP